MLSTKRLLTAAILAGLAMLAAGCAGVGTTASENNFRVQQEMNANVRMWNDDIMLLTQTNRPWRGSRVPQP